MALVGIHPNYTGDDMQTAGFLVKNAGRICLWAKGILLVAFAIALFVTGIRFGGSEIQEPSFAVTTVTVGKGDTLWSLAKKYGDPDIYILQRIHQLQSINSIRDRDALQIGQELLVPVGRDDSKLIYGGGHEKRERQNAKSDDCRFPAKIGPGRDRGSGA
jgi:hypothetical protein